MRNLLFGGFSRFELRLSYIYGLFIKRCISIDDLIFCQSRMIKIFQMMVEHLFSIISDHAFINESFISTRVCSPV